MGNPREPAFRIFADEFNRSSIKVEGEGEYSPNHVISPLGAKINRIFIVGVLTDVENMGDPDEPFFRAKVSDTTGHFFLSAGQYNPAATAALADMSFPTYVAVVGKVRTFEPEDGGFYVSVNPEIIKEVDDKMREYWCVKTAKSTKERIEAYLEAEKMAKPDRAELEKLGFSSMVAEGAILALEHYGSVDTDMYFRSMVSAVSTVLKEKGDEGIMAAPVRDVDGEYRTSFDAEEEVKTEDAGGGLSEDEQDDLILSIIDEADSLDPNNDGGLWDDILRLSGEKKITREALEESMGRLLNRGSIYEPVLGRMKKV